jgi:PAS domain S-box-containing protein
MSLRLKLTLSSMLVLTLSLALVTTFTLVTMNQQFQQQQQSRVLQLGPLLNAALSVPVVQRDYASVQAILEESLEDPALVRVAFYDPSDRLMASAQMAASPDEVAGMATWPEFRVPLRLAGQDLGSVTFTLSREDLDLAQARLTRYVLAVGAVVLLFFSGLLWLVSGTVTRRLGLLVNASRSIWQGHYHPELPPASKDEVGELIQAFSTMGAEIDRKVRELQALTEGLEQQVAERTHDLTLRTHELGRSIRDLETQTYLLNHAPFAVLVLDSSTTELKIVDTTVAVSTLFGYAEKSLNGLSVRVLEPAGLHGLVIRQAMMALERSRPVEWEMEVLCRSGATRWSRALAFAIRDPLQQESRVALCLVDIQELRNAREDQRKLAGELQEANKLKSVGLAMAGIAHELNTPVGIALTASTKMRSIVDAIVANGSPGADPQPVSLDRLRRLHTASNLIASNMSKAGALVTGLKRTAAHSARMEKRRVVLLPFFEELLVTLSPITHRESCNVRLTCPSNLTTYTEPGSLGQMVTNLVVNATVHAFDGRDHRELSIEVSQVGHTIEIRLSDNGNGMSAEALAKAFTPFYTTRRELGGSGLGLFSARRVVEEVLGGTIAVQSSRGAGTSFLIVLPLLDDVAQTAPKPAS